jgi:hypothetical protein
LITRPDFVRQLLLFGLIGSRATPVKDGGQYHSEKKEWWHLRENSQQAADAVYVVASFVSN